jgi:hypothetical protein
MTANHRTCLSSSTQTVEEFYNRTAICRSFLFLFIFFTLNHSLALPKDIANYQMLNGGLTNIENGAYVEGSVAKGGIQPDYKIDLDSEPLKTFLEKCKSIRLLNVPYWDKVGLIVELTNTDFFKYTNYSNPYYRRLLKKYRSEGIDVPLSEYGVCSAGVCREHALVLHFALKAAGINNRHAYAEIHRASRYDNFDLVEDHAFNVVEHKGVEWVVDSYYWGFNGFRLKDLMQKSGVTEDSPHAPIANPRPGTRSILKINSFPKIYNPISSLRCQGVFHE